MMNRQFFLFSLGERLLALPLEVVERVVAMVEVTPLPSKPVTSEEAITEDTTFATPDDDEASIPTTDTASEIAPETSTFLTHVRGVINVQGRIMPVVDVRAWLGMEEREAQLSDRLLILRVG